MCTTKNEPRTNVRSVDTGTSVCTHKQMQGWTHDTQPRAKIIVKLVDTHLKLGSE